LPPYLHPVQWDKPYQELPTSSQKYTLIAGGLNTLITSVFIYV